MCREEGPGRPGAAKIEWVLICLFDSRNAVLLEIMPPPLCYNVSHYFISVLKRFGTCQARLCPFSVPLKM
jgi:hypothetical protein